MAQYLGAQATNLAAVPVVKVPPGQGGGFVRCSFDTYVSAAALNTNDTILIGMPLPPGSRVIDVHVSTILGMGGSGAINVGWNVNTSDSDTANTSGWWAALAFASAGVNVGLSSVTGNGAAPGLNKLFASANTVPFVPAQIIAPEIQPVITASTGGSTANTDYNLKVFFLVY